MVSVPNPPPLTGALWYCATCLREYCCTGLRDLILNTELMEYLAVGSIGGDMDVLAHCSLAARYLWLDKGGCLWTKGKFGYWAEVPPIGLRLLIV